MDDLREPGPDDVVAAAEASHALLSPLVDMDWSVIAGDLEWGLPPDPGARMPSSSCSMPLSAAAPSQRRLPTARINNLGPVHRPVGTGSPRIEQRARRSPAQPCPRTRGAFTPPGSPTATDSPRWPARRPSCIRGTSRAVSASTSPRLRTSPRSRWPRLFPWVQDEGDPWQTLLYAAGRRDLGGNDRRAPNWSWQCAPLSEWKGDVRVRPR